MSQFGGVFGGAEVLVTGHTGFKGSWLCLWLESLGAEVTGFALPPGTQPNHFDLVKPELRDVRGDIRDADAVNGAFAAARPAIVIHMAAQPLVRRSYRDPVGTWSTNIMGTVNVLEAVRRAPSVKAAVVVTTDKCYENKNQAQGYREGDPLGGHDPYSASKAATELLVTSYRRSFFHEAGSARIATARAGNVIGGGDWSEDRLIPDLARAASNNENLVVRSPKATRPWQHVLDALSGYLLLAQKLAEGDASVARAWNFGPGADGNRTVEDVLAMMKAAWPGIGWTLDQNPQPHEAALLQLDSAQARQKLGWKPVWTLEQGVRETALWYRDYIAHGRVISRDQLAAYAEQRKKAA
jgi:CDP-glucose 4,6-dehydratase